MKIVTRPSTFLKAEYSFRSRRQKVTVIKVLLVKMNVRTVLEKIEVTSSFLV